MYCYFRLSVVVVIIWETFFELVAVDDTRISVGISTLSNTSRNISISDLGGHIAISSCRSLTQSFGVTLFELVMVENSRIAVGISWLLSIIVP